MDKLCKKKILIAIEKQIKDIICFSIDITKKTLQKTFEGGKKEQKTEHFVAATSYNR